MARLPDAWRLIAGFLGFSAVVIGAIAAHGLSDALAIGAVERASTYQLVHSVILIVTTLISGRAAQISRWLLLFGIILFCGSIYAKYLFEFANATKFAPSGGVLLMLGWLSLALSAKAQAK